MRARSGLMRRSERLEGIGGFLSRAEGCWTFDARDRVPQSSPSTAHRPAQLRTGGDARPSRESGFVQCADSGQRRRILIVERLLLAVPHSAFNTGVWCADMRCQSATDEYQCCSKSTEDVRHLAKD